MRSFSTLQQVVNASAAAIKPNPILQYFLDLPSQNSLKETFPGVPRSSSGVAPVPSPVALTKLPNGVTVVSQDAHGAVASVGLHFKAGSRYESVAGTTHLLEHAAFSGTNHRSALKLYKDAEEMGGSYSASTSREEFVYSGKVLRGDAEGMVELLAEAALEPKFRSWTVEEVKHAAFQDSMEAKASSPLSLLMEAVYSGAYGGDSGMGRRQWAEEGDLEGLTSEALLGHIKAYFTGDRAVLSAVNIPHEALVEMGKLYLGALPAGSGAAAPPSTPAWKGGEGLLRSVRGVGSARVALALPAPSLAANPKTAAAASVLTALLGGSPPSPRSGRPEPFFPGNSRLAVAARESGTKCSAFYLPGTDSGLIGVMGSTPVSSESGETVDVRSLINLLAASLKGAAATPASPTELARAKASAKMWVAERADGRDSRAGGFASAVLRGAAAAGGADTLAAELAAIDSVGAGDVAAVAKQSLSAPPSVAAISSLEGFPRYEQVAALLK